MHSRSMAYAAGTIRVFGNEFNCKEIQVFAAMKDYFGKDASLLKTKKLWLFDMDGTIYNENTLFDGTLDLLEGIRASGGRSVFITNNSSRSVLDYVAKVNRMGISAGPEDFFTSSQATILWLKKNAPGAKVYCQGTRSLVAELREAGIQVTEEVEPVDVVLIGFDTEMTSEKLRRTCQILTEQEVVYIGANPDLVCPVSFGYVPDCGSISIMIKNATKKEPFFIGKPEPTMIRIVQEKWACRPEDTVVIGDRLYTDIAAGLNAGVTAVCVLPGEATLEDLSKADRQPTLTFQNVRVMADLLFPQ